MLIGNEAERYPADAWRLLQFCHAFRLVGSADPTEWREHTRLAMAHFEPDLVWVDGFDQSPERTVSE